MTIAVIFQRYSRIPDATITCADARIVKGRPCPGTQGCYDRWTGKRGSADLRLPGLRCCDDYDRNPGAQTAHSCAASTWRCAMNTHTWQTRNYLSFIYRLEPIREGLAWCRKIHDFGPMRQRKVHHVGIKPEHLISVITQRMGLLAKLKTDQLFKSP